jgi:hypothetical protein
VAASVSVPNLIAPDDTPMPPELPKQPGRVYGSTAAGAPEAAATSPAAAPAAPVSPGQPMPGIRATARATIPVARPEPGDAPPPATRSSTVYGSATGTAAPNQMPPAAMPPNQAPGWQSRPHAYGDLFGPGQGMPEAALQAMPQAEAPSIPAQRMPEPQAHFAPAPPMGMPPGAHPGGPMAPPRGPAAPPPADDAKPERKGRIIVGVLVVGVALLAVAFGVLFLANNVINGATFTVGDCVKQSDAAAVKADCGETGAFKVTASVNDPAQCQDQTQPHVQQGNVIYCLAPATSGGNDVNPTTTPAAGGTPTPGPSATK